mmetsp:Transcript_15184/g.24950  ORF Transcript_15184/g.24950 Transcript_15184/m.24950 type:complete len:437 (+) Transcript_15184:128-1438(+)
MRRSSSFRSASLTQQLLAVSILCCFPLIYQFQTLYYLTTIKDVEIKQGFANQSERNNICKFAEDVESQNYTSYKLGLDWSNVDHVTKMLCRRLSQSSNYNGNIIKNETSIVLIFKVARSGSTFFSDVILRALQAMNRPAYLNFEPYCREGCYHLKTHQLMEAELSTILSSNCTNTTEDPPLCNTTDTHKKCCPVPKCHKKFNHSAIPVLSLNPRFLDNVRWDKILSPSFQRTSSAKVFNLRRTNLVEMAYSKFHHDGCPVIHGFNDCIPEEKGNLTTPFSFDCLLQCVQHYGIGDQEFSSSVAFVAAENTKMHQPHLVLYEDVMRDQSHASKEVFNYIDVTVHDGDNFFNKTNQKKLHNDNICSYADVNCSDLKVKLGKLYPCLLKQLHSNSTVAWSVPVMRAAGKIKVNIRGDCHRLQNLDTKSHTYRDYEELYI